MATKESILKAALTLFAEHGYDGTGVDLIAEGAGIKGPSLYRHFKSKEEVLNALVDNAEARCSEYFDTTIISIPRTRKEFVKMVREKIESMITDSVARKTRIFLVRTQFRGERIAKLTNIYQLDGLANIFERVISGMMKEGLIKKDKPEQLAMELTAPAMLLVSKVDRLPETEKETLKAIDKHIRRFCDEYLI